MNLPDMLRAENPMCERRSATPEEWQKNGKWTLYPIGPELAALVEAQDEYFRLNLPLHHDGDCSCDYCTAANKVATARAALVAKIGGKG